MSSFNRILAECYNGASSVAYVGCVFLVIKCNIIGFFILFFIGVFCGCVADYWGGKIE